MSITPYLRPSSRAVSSVCMVPKRLTSSSRNSTRSVWVPLACIRALMSAPTITRARPGSVFTVSVLRLRNTSMAPCAMSVALNAFPQTRLAYSGTESHWVSLAAVEWTLEGVLGHGDEDADRLLDEVGAGLVVHPG